MEDIVAATGLYAPAVCRYIASKEELILSAAIESVHQADDARAALLESDPLPGPTAALGVMMRQFGWSGRQLTRAAGAAPRIPPRATGGVPRLLVMCTRSGPRSRPGAGR
ncbi:MAG: hypothetical protein ACLPQY_11030 [Streptosporangiaceae bacterium]